jgi:hypothetical protein
VENTQFIFNLTFFSVEQYLSKSFIMRDIKFLIILLSLNQFEVLKKRNLTKVNILLNNLFCQPFIICSYPLYLIKRSSYILIQFNSFIQESVCYLYTIVNFIFNRSLFMYMNIYHKTSYYLQLSQLKNNFF